MRIYTVNPTKPTPFGISSVANYHGQDRTMLDGFALQQLCASPRGLPFEMCASATKTADAIDYANSYVDVLAYLMTECKELGVPFSDAMIIQALDAGMDKALTEAVVTRVTDLIAVPDADFPLVNGGSAADAKAAIGVAFDTFADYPTVPHLWMNHAMAVEAEALLKQVGDHMETKFGGRVIISSAIPDSAPLVVSGRPHIEQTANQVNNAFDHENNETTRLVERAARVAFECYLGYVTVA